MKLASFYLQPKIGRVPLVRFLLLSPLLSARIHRGHEKSHLIFIILKLFLGISFLTLVILFTNYFLLPLTWWKLVLISPLIYFLTEVLGAMGELLFYASPMKLIPIHHHPLQSLSLGDFWGRRWNIWVQDWLRDISSGFRTKLKTKIFVSFFASGVFHELMCNMTWWLLYKESYFGNMLLYFAIQGLGLWVEKKWVKRAHPWLRRFYLWALVILPAPIFINKPLQVFLGIEHG